MMLSKSAPCRRCRSSGGYRRTGAGRFVRYRSWPLSARPFSPGRPAVGGRARRPAWTCRFSSTATAWRSHFEGVPGSLVYDRTKTVVRRHVAPGKAVPGHPDAAFADHYGFAIDVLAARRTQSQGPGRTALRDRPLARAGRPVVWLVGGYGRRVRRMAAHSPRPGASHPPAGSASGAKADRAALTTPLPAMPYLVAEPHLRRAGKDCLVSFEASSYSLPAALIRAGQ